MSKKTERVGLVEIHQSAKFEEKKQQVEYWRNLYQFALDIPWTFTYHTRTRVKEVRVNAGVV